MVHIGVARGGPNVAVKYGIDVDIISVGVESTISILGLEDIYKTCSSASQV